MMILAIKLWMYDIQIWIYYNLRKHEKFDQTTWFRTPLDSQNHIAWWFMTTSGALIPCIPVTSKLLRSIVITSLYIYILQYYIYMYIWTRGLTGIFQIISDPNISPLLGHHSSGLTNGLTPSIAAGFTETPAVMALRKTAAAWEGHRLPG